MTTKADGAVIRFDRETCWGVLVSEGRRREFHSTCFHGGRPARFPRVGEKVEVVLNERDAIVEVRALT